MKKIAVLFGGVSAEHDVSVISGLQVIENIDREKYEVFPVLLDQSSIFNLFPDFEDKKDYKKQNSTPIKFARDKNGAYIQKDTSLSRKIYIDAAYLAFHGGNGENGEVQGFLDTIRLSYTSPSTESSVIVMNKSLTKTVLEEHGINTVKSISVFSRDVKKDADSAVKDVLKKIKLPVIIKPVHLGSSIGINIAKKQVELKKYLLEAAHVDREILVEKMLSNFTEYNCAVRKVNGKVETSEIEKPINKDEILSFADKYQRGNKKQSGMASLNRELPAKIPKSLKTKIENSAKLAFMHTRCKGMVRIDFMYTKSKQLYLTEINPIPGSMSYYLWEASGVTFTQQITDLIEQSFKDFKTKESKKINYESDIVDKFTRS